MKKVITILVIMILGYSCSSDDSPAQDKVIGEWQHTKTLRITYGGAETEDLVGGCQLLSRFIINADGTFVEREFDFNAVFDECREQNSSFTGDKIWAKSLNGQYVFHQISTNPSYDSVYEVAVESSFTGNTMELKFKEVNSNPNNPDDIEYYIRTYQKQ